jgi:DNA invertase Pin-like site-specific DNA recombinase
MLNDAKNGVFDLVITKSVSRLTGSLLDSINLARELVDLPIPIGIFFEDEGINSLSLVGDFILSILYMVAQGECKKKRYIVKKLCQLTPRIIQTRHIGNKNIVHQPPDPP